MNTPAIYAKAVIGALIAGLGALAVALTDEVVTTGEWVGAAIATLVALGGVYVTPNRDPAGAHQRESVQPPERGATDVVTVLVVVVLVVLALVLLGVLR